MIDLDMTDVRFTPPHARVGVRPSTPADRSPRPWPRGPPSRGVGRGPAGRARGPRRDAPCCCVGRWARCRPGTSRTAPATRRPGLRHRSFGPRRPVRRDRGRRRRPTDRAAVAATRRPGPRRPTQPILTHDGRHAARLIQLTRLLAGPFGGEAQQQPPRVAIRRDDAGARASLGDQTLREERLEGRGERAHSRAPTMPLAVWATMTELFALVMGGALLEVLRPACCTDPTAGEAFVSAPSVVSGCQRDRRGEEAA
jgi:hypothetical protein